MHDEQKYFLLSEIEELSLEQEKNIKELTPVISLFQEKITSGEVTQRKIGNEKNVPGQIRFSKRCDVAYLCFNEFTEGLTGEVGSMIAVRSVGDNFFMINGSLVESSKIEPFVDKKIQEENSQKPLLSSGDICNNLQNY